MQLRQGIIFLHIFFVSFFKSLTLLFLLMCRWFETKCLGQWWMDVLTEWWCLEHSSSTSQQGSENTNEININSTNVQKSCDNNQSNSNSQIVLKNSKWALYIGRILSSKPSDVGEVLLFHLFRYENKHEKTATFDTHTRLARQKSCRPFLTLKTKIFFNTPGVSEARVTTAVRQTPKKITSNRVGVNENSAQRLSKQTLKTHCGAKFQGSLSKNLSFTIRRWTPFCLVKTNQNETLWWVCIFS